MEFGYSTVVDPSTYNTEGLCEGIPLRKHMDPWKENIGAGRAQQDWAKLVRPISQYKGGLGPEYSFIRVTVPECLPERLEIIAYANEFAFLYDDAMENIDQDTANEESHQLLEVFGEGALKSSGPKDLGAKQIQSQILAEMMALDRGRALTAMKAWAKFVQLSSSRRRSVPFTSLKEYLPYRIIDAGELIWFGTVTFGMALTIPEEEMDLCKQLVQPVFAALSLTNDLFSWEKERDAAKQLGFSHVINAIWVLMEERSITEPEAKDVCRAMIKENVAKYLLIVKETRNNLDISLDLRKYVEALQYSHSGNLVWSIYCPRYHPDVSYNGIQMSMMENGAKETLVV